MEYNGDTDIELYYIIDLMLHTTFFFIFQVINYYVYYSEFAYFDSVIWEDLEENYSSF